MDEGNSRQETSGSSSDSSMDESDGLGMKGDIKNKKVEYCEHLNNISMKDLKRRFKDENFQVCLQNFEFILINIFIQ